MIPRLAPYELSLRFCSSRTEKVPKAIVPLKNLWFMEFFPSDFNETSLKARGSQVGYHFEANLTMICISKKIKIYLSVNKNWCEFWLCRHKFG